MANLSVLVSFGFWPRCLSALLFSWRNPNLAGDLGVVSVVALFDVSVNDCVHVLTFLRTAYSHVRTEPQSVVGHTRGKKIVACPSFVSSHELNNYFFWPAPLPFGKS